LYYVKTSKRISILNGNQYTLEIMDSENKDRTIRILRMPKETFCKLVIVLRTNGLLMDFEKRDYCGATGDAIYAYRGWIN
jgi:hypothetical protein